MKTLASARFLIVVGIMLTACAPGGPATEEAAAGLRPGGQIGAMSVDPGEPLLPYQSLWRFCDYMSDSVEPASSTSECTVPSLSGVTIQFGWLAKASHLESNWQDMTWELSIDERAVDLLSFGLQESAYVAHGEDNSSRIWLIDLKNPTPGEHTLRLVQTYKAAVDDGFKVYQPGRHEHVVRFTVAEAMAYPALSSDATAGQHAYRSESTKLNFLLYVPAGYAEDAQEEWPLIVYLHGAPLRGTTPELLREESFPRELDRGSDLPYVALSPVGAGGFEFWAKDDMMEALLALVDEVRGQYRIDARRIYLTGNDMGGNGVWAIGLAHPEYFAALAPVAGYGAYPFEVPEEICNLRDVPVWAFHGARDEYVPLEVEQALVDALVACGGEASLTVSQDMKNDVPFKVFADPALYEWLLSQSLQ